MNNQKKYLKYKIKYHELKNQIGGMFNIGDRVRVTGDNNIVVLNHSGEKNYSDVEGEIIESKVTPNGTRVYYLSTQFGYALEINSIWHNITLIRVPEGQVQRLAHLGLKFNFPPPSDPPLRFTSALPVAFAHQPPPDPPNYGFSFNPPPPSPPERRRYHIYQLDDIVSVNGDIRLGLFKDQQNLSNTSVYKKIGKIIRANEYSYKIPIYDIQFDDTLSFGVNEDFIKKLTHQEILSRQQAAEQRALDQHELELERRQEELERQILERRQQELEQQILAAQQQQQPWLQQERPLAEARRETGTRKARVSRNDGQADFIKLREIPNQSSKFKPVPDLPNGTIVDIFEGEELNAEWQYVRFSPEQDTSVSGWVKKIYLQYL